MCYGFKKGIADTDIAEFNDTLSASKLLKAL